jgi:CRISPR-associated protein Csd1
MILQELYDYYQRKMAEPESQIAAEGWEWKEIPFIIVIDEEGGFRSIQDNREGEKKQRTTKKFLVPQSEKRTASIKANLLWDNVEYALGANPRDRSDVKLRHQAFKDRISKNIQNFDDPKPAMAVLKFLSQDPLRQISNNALVADLWKEAFSTNAFVTFKIWGLENSSIFDGIKLKNEVNGKNGNEQICLVTGEKDQVARLHASIKGVMKSQSSGAALSSFNLPAFCSYGKRQNENAPIGEKAAFAYTTALNAMLGRDSKNKTNAADATILFWSKQSESTGYDFEEDFPWIVADSPKDDPDRGVLAVKSLYDAVYSGRLPSDSDNRFFVLALAPNSARIAVRFWREGKVRDFAEKILKHFEDVSITHSPREQEYVSLARLLRSTALAYKMENIPPNIAGSVISSVLDGTPYPRTLLQQCIRRIRAESSVTRERAGILKACLNRQRDKSAQKEVLQVSLDRANTNVAYRLGRLFAVMEKAQEEANPGINATIRDRFYGAASSSPVAVFPQLLKLKNHHIAKLANPGRRVNLEKEIGEIMEEITKFPGHMSLDEQAYFAVGYYHQRQDFFISKNNK